MASKKNSLVNNINKKKKAGTSRSKKNSTISSKSYDKMEHNWGKSKKGTKKSSKMKSKKTKS